MNGINETTLTRKPNEPAPILKLNRQNFVKLSGQVLDSTEEKLRCYIAFATERMKIKVTSGDVIEHGLQLLFDRDKAFKTWLKER
jgi:hypothetical protein